MDSATTLHLVNPLRNPFGGSEWRVVEMRRLLERHAQVDVWAAPDAAPSLLRATQARVLRPVLGQFPRGGTLVFVGTYFTVGRWIAMAAPKRVLVIFNTDQPLWLRANLSRIAASGCSAEVIYTSHGLRERSGGIGPVLESPIDLARFAYRDPVDAPQRPFTVGRHSRDDASKHHADDPALYKRLAAAGIRVRLMGATCLAPALDGTPGIEILPEGAMPAHDFLRGLDAFVYRTASTWYEAFGRVVFEAMAAGVPVACSPAGGYATYLSPSLDALVGEGNDALCANLIALRDDRTLAASLARRGRERAEAVQRHAEQALIELLVGVDREALSAVRAGDRDESAPGGAGSPPATRARTAGRG